LKKKTKYSNGEIGKVEVIKDFLPKPEDLVNKEKVTKKTLRVMLKNQGKLRKFKGKLKWGR
jgi:hypothetical protein